MTLFHVSQPERECLPKDNSFHLHPSMDFDRKSKVRYNIDIMKH